MPLALLLLLPQHHGTAFRHRTMAHSSSHFGTGPVGNPGPFSLFPSDWPCTCFRQRADLSFVVAPPLWETRTGIPTGVWQTEPQRWWTVIHEDDLAAMRLHLARVGQQAQPLECAFRIRHAITARVSYLREIRRAVASEESREWAYAGMWLDCRMERELENLTAQALWLGHLSGLTRSFTHDFNNALAGILSLSDFFLSQVEPEHPMREGLALIKQNAQRATLSVGRLTRLHQFKRSSRAYHDLNELTRDIGHLLRQSLPRRSEVKEQLTTEALPVYLDADAFAQALLNTTLSCLGESPDIKTLTLTTLGAPVALSDRGHELLAVRSQPSVGMALQLPLPSETVTAHSHTHPLWAVWRFAEIHGAGLRVESNRQDPLSTVTLSIPQADFTEADTERALESARPRRVLLVARQGSEHEELVQALRREQCQVVSCFSDPQHVLADPDELWDATYITHGAEGADWANWVKMVRSQNPASIVVIDEIDASANESSAAQLQIDLVLAKDANASARAAKIATYLQRSKP